MDQFELTPDEIAQNLKTVQENVAKACERVHRNPSEVAICAVSKLKSVQDIQAAMTAGQKLFGENYVQEIREKYEELGDSCEWHMIGHLQRNKVHQVVGKACLIHSVDSLRLAQTISHEAEKQDLDVPVLVEVNVAREESKFGVTTEETIALGEEMSKLPRVQIRGLMTIAPFVEDPEDNREIFRKLKQLSVDIAAKNINNVNMSVLSMGMTNDYEVAIEEGATMVRVGTGIFGERDYTK